MISVAKKMVGSALLLSCAASANAQLNPQPSDIRGGAFDMTPITHNSQPTGSVMASAEKRIVKGGAYDMSACTLTAAVVAQPLHHRTPVSRLHESPNLLFVPGSTKGHV